MERLLSESAYLSLKNAFPSSLEQFEVTTFFFSFICYFFFILSSIGYRLSTEIFASGAITFLDADTIFQQYLRVFCDAH